jgi:hypothetical protein
LLNLPSKHRELPLADSSIQLYTGNPYFDMFYCETPIPTSDL